MIFKKLLPLDNLKKTTDRFPHAVVCSFVLFFIALWLIHGDIEPLEDTAIFRVIALCCYGFFWFCLSQLLSEGLVWSPVYNRGLTYGVYAVLAGLIVFDGGSSLAWFLILMVPALLLGISVGPYIRSRDNLSLWFYNRQTWQGVLVSILAGLIWGAGVSAVLVSVSYLFEIEIPGDVYADFWSFAMIVFAPLYALSWIPEKFDYTEEDCHAPPQLAFVLNWVLAPLVLVYMAILYAYFVKIIFMGELPRGQLATMVMVFGGTGIVTYLAGWPLRENGGVLLRLFYRLFFPALIVPVCMMGYATYLRIDQYGLTEQRYLLGLCVLWMGALSVLFTVRKPPLKIVAGSLAVLLLAVSIGPLSAVHLSVLSQMSRLESLLIGHGILVEGQIVKTEEDPSYEDRKQISSSVLFLSQRKKLEELRPWLGGLDENQDLTLHNVMEEIGFAYVSPSRYSSGPRVPQQEMRHLQGAYAHKVLDVEGFRYLFDTVYVDFHKNTEWSHSWEGTGVTAQAEGHNLVISVAGKGRVVLDVFEFASRQYEQNPSSDRRDLELEAVADGVRVRLIFDFINLKKKQGEADYQLSNYSFRALVGY